MVDDRRYFDRAVAEAMGVAYSAQGKRTAHRVTEKHLIRLMLGGL